MILLHPPLVIHDVAEAGACFNLQCVGHAEAKGLAVAVLDASSLRSAGFASLAEDEIDSMCWTLPQLAVHVQQRLLRGSGVGYSGSSLTWLCRSC